ncbi:MAG: DUF885 domain-containing protein [Steroidobacteraceae bacterium]
MWPDPTDRRSFLIQAAGATAAMVLPGRAGALSGEGGAPATEAARLNRLFERIFNEQMRETPQTMTSLGLDTGKGAWARSKLDDQSRAHADRLIPLQRRWLAQLRQIDLRQLSGTDATNYSAVRYQIELALQGVQSFKFGADGFPAPYLLSQLTGSYQAVPDFLHAQHVVADRSDAEAYLARLKEFARVVDEETARARGDAAAGVVPPDFIIGQALEQMRALRTTPVSETDLVASLVQRARQKHISGDWSARAAVLVSGSVWPALDRQIALLQSWRSVATANAGVWALPHGEEYYRFALHYQTTTGMTPDEVHQRGLELVAEISGAADTLLSQQGLSHGTVGQRFAALYKDPRFVYPNTDEARAQLLAYLNGCVKAVTAKLPAYFGTLPTAGLEIRRIPVAVEAGAPGGYYEDGSLDGSRPGAYYINLRNMTEVPRWTLPTLTYHEGIPGHHFQGALILEEPGVPMIRRTLWFTAYGEGWAVYAEQLADEMGLYATDPWGRAGYLQGALLRALRLVLDTGLHARRWTRSRAIRYYMGTMGAPESGAMAEVDRYCVWPGQACSYMIGKLMWLKLRSQSRALLGPKFDIRKFHDAGLLCGPLPLELLERRIDTWARQQV